MELKFRVWDTEQEIWIEDDFHIDRDGNIVRFDNDGREWVEPTSQKRYILMLYTGLQDKHGKEIYEGDIVFNHWTNINGRELGQRWVVKYGTHSVEGHDYYSNEAAGFYYDHGGDTYNIISLPGEVEIIGNRWENPELMEEK